MSEPVGDPLIAPVSSAGPSPWAGVWIAEDIELIIQGLQSGSWIDASIGGLSAGLDALALMSDPLGGLLQYGIAWLIEHVKPLSEALDWLAGDPAQIAAHAQTWRNAAGRLREQADVLARSVAWDVPEWTGAASEAYRAHATARVRTLDTLALAADGTALITESAGVLVATVRVMVRDAIATVVSRLVVYAGEVLASFGAATPLVVEQVTTLVAAWGARIAKWLRGLIASLRKMGDFTRQLGDKVAELTKRDAKGGTPGGGDPQPGRNPLPSGPPPWRAPDDLPGPARGKDLHPPNKRHTVAGARSGQIKDPTTVILRGNESMVRDDIKDIAAGNANFSRETGRYEVNGRTYDVHHETGTVFPVSGPGLVKLSGKEYHALKLIARADGDPSAVREFAHNPYFRGHPGTIAKAKAIYDGTYRQ